ncbi:CPBP family intramembrane glutamic endopeptidase [Belliella marina]|uniref:CPBP family intramembrane glutamic endopeptidase n=1 Tax=Belliella marina TaxID=1644146 RepID=A0ABW4VNN4_9BACT
MSLVVIVLVTFGVMAILQGISLFLVNPIFGIPMDELIAILSGSSTNPNARIAILFVQGIGAGLSFFIAALLVAKLIDKADLGWKQQLAKFKFNGFLLMIILLAGGMMFNALLIDWNSNIVLPEFLSSFENWAKEKEDQAMAITKYITDFDNHSQFLVGILVVGVLAGLGEEFLFRGVLQPKFQQYTGNAHVGIWLAAFVFSAIHFQFYGFFPRMLLGAIFGYLYLYSGSLIYPILAHILNNTTTLVLVYMGKLGKLDFDIEETDSVSIPIAIVGLLILLIGLNVFKEMNKPKMIDGKLD